tara:strand:- start:109 stop:357 length:249 start_codon:yes stop_codon:yes gene_type:complete
MKTETILLSASTVFLGFIAFSLTSIGEAAKSFNYCVEQKVAYWVKIDEEEHPWTRSNMVAFCNGKTSKVRITKMPTVKKGDS